jgi:hypothetical protein
LANLGSVKDFDIQSKGVWNFLWDEISVEVLSQMIGCFNAITLVEITTSN